MTRTFIVAAAAALGLALVAGVAQRALAQEGAEQPQAEEKAEPKAPAPRPHLHRGGMAVKPVVCRVVPEAQGKTGQDLANAIEAMGAQFHRSNYRLTALLPGDPPIACFASNSDPSKLPMGAR